jgi:hypothetical protein
VTTAGIGHEDEDSILEDAFGSGFEKNHKDIVFTLVDTPYTPISTRLMMKKKVKKRVKKGRKDI